MRPQISKFVLLGFALALPFAALTQQTTRPVTIQVIDASGAPVPHAQIHLVPAPDPAPTKLETDEHGSLSFNLKAGSYALVVSEPGFKNWSESIYVANSDGQTTVSQLCPVVLQVGQYSGPMVTYPINTLVLIAGA